jgi:hypothetical protein
MGRSRSGIERIDIQSVGKNGIFRRLDLSAARGKTGFRLHAAAILREGRNARQRNAGQSQQEFFHGDFP